MNNLITPMLAIGTTELIVIIVFLAISGIQYIFKEMKKSKEMREQRERRLQAEQRGDFSGAQTDETESVKPVETQMRGQLGTGKTGERLEDIAARRRREIAAMNRPGAPTPGQPDNMTMQQMRQRAAAKAEYEKRAAALRQRQSAGEVQSTQPSRTAAAQRRAQPIDLAETDPQDMTRQQQVRETQEQARTQAEARKQAELQRQRQQAARQQQQRAQQVQSSNLRQTVAGRPTLRPTNLRPVIDEQEEGQRRSSVTGARELSQRTAAAVTAAAPVAQVKLSTGNVVLNVKSLRDAVVLREILDPPMALR